MRVARPLRAVDERLGGIEARIDAHLQDAARAAEASGDALQAYVAGGKRLRARLVIAAGSVGRCRNDEDLARYGAFVELIHAGGLCHDDVVDRSPRRRSRPSLACSHGVRMASLAGLHLMMRAYTLVADSSTAVREEVARTAACVASGQADEMMDLHRVDVEPERYVERCRAKTGALFALAAELGARATRVAPAVRSLLVAFGAEIGLAFQLVDDVRDLRGEAVIGRAPGTDLREGVYTLPVLTTVRGRHDGADELRRLLRRLRTVDDPAAVIAEAQRLLWANGSVSASLDVASEALRRARRSIETLPASARRTFEKFADAAVLAGLRRPGKATAA